MEILLVWLELSSQQGQPKALGKNCSREAKPKDLVLCSGLSTQQHHSWSRCAFLSTLPHATMG